MTDITYFNKIKSGGRGNSLGSTGNSCVLPSSFSIPMGRADSGTAGAMEEWEEQHLNRFMTA